MSAKLMPRMKSGAMWPMSIPVKCCGFPESLSGMLLTLQNPHNLSCRRGRGVERQPSRHPPPDRDSYTEVQDRCPKRTMEYGNAPVLGRVVRQTGWHPHPPTKMLLPFVG
jgi:hypothetical protein